MTSLNITEDDIPGLNGKVVVITGINGEKNFLLQSTFPPKVFPSGQARCFSGFSSLCTLSTERNKEKRREYKLTSKILLQGDARESAWQRLESSHLEGQKYMPSI